MRLPALASPAAAGAHRPTQRRVLELLHRSLRPDGLLFAGHAENFTDHADLFALAGRTVYRRAG